MIMKKKRWLSILLILTLMLGLLPELGSTALAANYDSLTDGMVLHVGDTISSSLSGSGADYIIINDAFVQSSTSPLTLVRVNISNNEDDPSGGLGGGLGGGNGEPPVIEDENGAYYALKYPSGDYSWFYENRVAVTEDSDGVVLTLEREHSSTQAEVYSVDVHEDESSCTHEFAAYDVTTAANKNKSGADLTALQVTFHGKPWYIIKDSSKTVNAGTVTLLAADDSFGTSNFSSSEWERDYTKSVVKNYLDQVMAGTAGEGEPDFSEVASAIVEHIEYGKLYLLSTGEARKLSSNVLQMNNSTSWWLRSPGNKYSDYVAFVNGENGSVNSDGCSVTSAGGVRPALKLRLQEVSFDSTSKVFSLKPAHPHSFTYSANGATITATCNADGCYLTNRQATLTIASPTIVGGAATLIGDTSEFDTLPTIQYATKSGSSWSNPSDTVPDTAGTYQASVTVEGQTASLEYSIYSVGVANDMTNGTVSVDSSLVFGGSKVKPTITPNAGFELESFTVNGTETTLDADGCFTMPEQDVTLNATFTARSVPVKLTVTGDKDGEGKTLDVATPLTASILTDDFQEVNTTDGEHPFTKRVGENFILRVTCDVDYTLKFSVKDSAAAQNLSTLDGRAFEKEEYEAYFNDRKTRGEPIYTRTKLFYVTVPSSVSGDLELTVAFSKIQLNTVLYQAPDGMDEVWCKYQYGTGSEGVTCISEMSREAKLGNQDVWSLKVMSGDSGKIAFAENKTELDSVTTDAMKDVTVKQSANNNDWEDYGTDGGTFLVIGGDAKIVTAAFITDSDKLVMFDDEKAKYTKKTEGTGETGATYQLAVCTTDGSGNVQTAGTVTAPAEPTAPTGHRFAGWKGLVKTADGTTEEKTYGAGTAGIEIREDTVFYSEWQLQEPKIAWNMNGGAGTGGDTSVTYNQKVSAPAAVPTKNGYTFDGWAVGKEVVEGGVQFSKGTLFDFDTNITDDLTLVAQWKHVHSYKYYKLDDPALGSALSGCEKYIPHLHVRYCVCGDYKLEAHRYDSSGKCVCGYVKPGSGAPSTLSITYGKLEGTTYRILMMEADREVKRNEKTTIYAPGALDDDLVFDKWQYRVDNNQNGTMDDDEWKDFFSSLAGAFVVPCNMEVRGLYKNPYTRPQIDLSTQKYNNSIMFWMNYKLPDGYTYVDSGVRAGDNAQISYYRRVEKENTKHSPTTGDGGVLFDILTGGMPGLDSALDSLFGLDEEKPQYTWEKREDNVLDSLGMSQKTLGEYMFQKKPINIPGDMLLWGSNPYTTGQTGSCYTLIPEKWGGKGNNGGNHWNYGYAFLKYKDPQGKLHTFHTKAVTACWNQVESARSHTTEEDATN